MLAEFEMLIPKTLSEALQMLADHAPHVAPIAGGTNMVVDLRSGRHCPATLVDVSRLAELRGIRRENGQLVIGSGTTISDLLREPMVAQYATPLRQAAGVFANPLVRNRATVGGNIADASPAADTAPALLVLGAEVELASIRGVRCVTLDDFFLHVRRTVREPDELIAAIRLPIPGPRCAGGFSKLGLRKADAIAVLSAAVMVDRDDDGRCSAARIALGAVAPVPLRACGAEAALVGQMFTTETIAEASRLAGAAAKPIDDVRGSAGYRRRVVEVLVRRLLTGVSTS